MKVWGITDRGNVRKQNQDVFYHWADDTNALALVCDGMGGARSGNVASAMAAQCFVEVLSSEAGAVQERMRTALEAANAAVRGRSKRDPDCHGMGTTLVAAFAKPGEAVVLNVGDSRCYHISAEGICQVTRDHSLVEQLVETGHLTREEARHHPHKNIITRALGTEEHVTGDFYQVHLAPGELLLLCSDGLSNEVPEETMLEICRSVPAEKRCAALLEQAKAAGAHDNVTVVLLEMDPDETH